jgi:Arm domain-containing DNA-binding protein
MPLTDAAIRTAKPRERAFRLFDGGGLYLEIAPSGGRWWRLKYRFDGKEKRLSLGV